MKGTPERRSAVYHTFNVEDLIEPGHPPSAWLLSCTFFVSMFLALGKRLG